MYCYCRWPSLSKDIDTQDPFLVKTLTPIGLAEVIVSHALVAEAMGLRLGLSHVIRVVAAALVEAGGVELSIIELRAGSGRGNRSHCTRARPVFCVVQSTCSGWSACRL